MSEREFDNASKLAQDFSNLFELDGMQSSRSQMFTFLSFQQSERSVQEVRRIRQRNWGGCLTLVIPDQSLESFSKMQWYAGKARKCVNGRDAFIKGDCGVEFPNTSIIFRTNGAGKGTALERE